MLRETGRETEKEKTSEKEDMAEVVREIKEARISNERERKEEIAKLEAKAEASAHEERRLREECARNYAALRECEASKISKDQRIRDLELELTHERSMKTTAHETSRELQEDNHSKYESVLALRRELESAEVEKIAAVAEVRRELEGAQESSERLVCLYEDQIAIAKQKFASELLEKLDRQVLVGLKSALQPKDNRKNAEASVDLLM